MYNMCIYTFDDDDDDDDERVILYFNIIKSTVCTVLYNITTCNGSNELWSFVRKIQRTIILAVVVQKKGGMPDLLKN